METFETIEQAKAVYPTPQAFREALVEDVHKGHGRFEDLEAVDLLRACGASPGDMDGFCISQVSTNPAAMRAGHEWGWGFKYTYRIEGKGRRTVRFQTVHEDGGVMDCCDGPYVPFRRPK
jgi:hypothetical protein